MANVISVINPKGGCGKTTLSIHLAAALNKEGYAVLLVDSDPQGSARDWGEEREEAEDKFPIIGADRPNVLRDTVKQMMENYDWIVIDGAGRYEESTAHAIVLSDLVVIPVQPSPLDVWAVAPLADQIKQRQILTDGVPAAAFQTMRVKKGTQLGREIRKAADQMDLPIFSGNIHDRTAFAKALAMGKTVFDLDGNGPAAREIDYLVKQIKEAFDE